MSSATQIISSILIGAAIIGAAAFAVVTYSDLKTRELDNQARYYCAQSSRYQTESDGALVWYPVQDMYQTCVAEMGVK